MPSLRMCGLSTNHVLLLWCLLYQSTLIGAWLTRPKQAPVLHRLNCDKANAFFGKRFNPFCQNPDPEKRGVSRRPLWSILQVLIHSGGHRRYPDIPDRAVVDWPQFRYSNKMPLFKHSRSSRDSDGKQSKQKLDTRLPQTEEGQKWLSKSDLTLNGEDIYDRGRIPDKHSRQQTAISGNNLRPDSPPSW